MNKILLPLVLVVLAAVAVGGYFFPRIAQNFGSSAGATFGTAKIALINWAPTTNAATSTYLYNNDGSDRVVKQFDYWCSGLTTVNGKPVAALTFNAATTTSNVSGTGGNTNYLLGTQVATSTSELWVSTTTPGATGTNDFRRWPTGTYIGINANASTTGLSCTIGVEYNPS